MQLDGVTAFFIVVAMLEAFVIVWARVERKKLHRQLESRTVLVRPHTARSVEEFGPLPEQVEPGDISDASFIRLNAPGSNSKFS